MVKYKTCLDIIHNKAFADIFVVNESCLWYKDVHINRDVYIHLQKYKYSKCNKFCLNVNSGHMILTFNQKRQKFIHAWQFMKIWSILTFMNEYINYIYN